DLKPVYTAPTEAAALERLAEFAGRWEARYPAIVKLWENAWAEFVPFLAFDVEIRKVICSTNAIESPVQMRGDPLGPAMPQLGTTRFEGVTQQRTVVPVGGGAGDPEWDAVSVDAGRALHPSFAPVDRAAAGPVAAARGLGDGPVGA